MPAPKLSPEQIQWACREYQRGTSITDLAEELDVSPGGIYYHLVERDLVDRTNAPRIVSLAPQGEWALDALCAQVDNDIFFPEKGGSTREAKSICTDCLVADECLDYALANNERFGIWGGLSERERRKLNTETRAAS